MLTLEVKGACAFLLSLEAWAFSNWVAEDVTILISSVYGASSI